MCLAALVHREMAPAKLRGGLNILFQVGKGLLLVGTA